MLARQVAITLTVFALLNLCGCANILMTTLGGTKSHKIPFWELARGLIPRGHNITFINAFPPDFLIPGLEEITPAQLVFYVKNFTNWDLVGPKMRGEEPVHPLAAVKYGYEACEMMLSDPEIKDFLYSPQRFDLIIMDGAYPECTLSFAYYYKVPFMYINTVGFYTGSLSIAGNPAPFSVTPFFGRPFTDSMNLLQRTHNTLWTVTAYTLMSFMTRYFVQDIVRKHFGNDVPSMYEISKNVSFILQNGHVSVSYSRPYLPNVAEIACIHCKPAQPLSQDLEEFISGSGDAGFVYFSMGSSVKASNMPEYLRRMLLRVFRQLPQRVLWKWEGTPDMPDLPANVRLERWLPQQDLLGHPKIKAFVTHGGLLSMFETVYHGVPIVTLPVFCDHDSNAAKAELDGYALKLELSTINSESLLWAIKKIIYDPKYRRAVKQRQILLKDQKETPLERAVYWTEYVLRHKGAKHLQSPAKDLNILQYYLVDVVAFLILCCLMALYVMKLISRFAYNCLMGNLSINVFKKSVKID